MSADLSSRRTGYALASALLVILVVITLALIGLSTPGYADKNITDLILQVLMQETPTPVPTPIAVACGVRISGSSVVATSTYGVELLNEGSAAAVEALTLVWPPDNGTLTQIKLGEQTIWRGEVAGPSVTVFPQLEEVIPSVKAGEQTRLSLIFSQPVVDGAYIILLHLGKSCYALLDTTQRSEQVESCFATFESFQVEEQQALLVLRNTMPEERSFRRLLLFWDDQQAAITPVKLGDRLLVNDIVRDSPAIISIPEGFPLQPDAAVALALTFDDIAPLVGYTVVFETENCQSVFSNVEPPTECPVRQEGDFVVTGTVAGLLLENIGRTEQPIQRIWLTFPESNGALVDVAVNGVSIANLAGGRFPIQDSPATLTVGDDLIAELSRLAPNSRSTLGFSFEQNALPQHYAVQVDFPNECRVLATTLDENVIPCRVQTAGERPLRTDANRVWLAVQNAGEGDATVQAITIDWDEQVNGALLEVKIGEDVFWQGRRTGGTATVTPSASSAVPPIRPGASVELQFTFEYGVFAHPYVFRIDFAEGCQLSYQTQPGLSEPIPVSLSGMITALPDDILDGVWEIVRGPDKYLYVRVTPQTQLFPPGVNPRLNDFVYVLALPLEQGEYLATRIDVTPNIVDRVQLTGVIDAVDPRDPPWYIVVQGVTVDLTPETTVNGLLEVGLIAEVQGLQRASGSILAETITTYERIARPAAFQGVVERWERLSDKEALWVVSGLEVVTHQENTVFHGIEPDQAPQIGAMVQVSGEMVSARRMYARELWYGPDEDVVEFEGIIRRLPENDDLLGIWVIQDDAVGPCRLDEEDAQAGCREVLVTSSTFIDASEAVPALNVPVDVRARQNLNSGLEALRIEIKSDD